VKRQLWKAAREVPSWHIAPALIGDLTDLVAGQSLVTFTNSSPAWGFNSSGVLVQPAANVPFVEYDPATGAALGWRVWDAVTNLFLRSQSLDLSPWTATGATITSDSLVAPDGTTTADLIVESATTDFHHASQNINITAGATYTYSVFLKASARTYVLLAVAGTGITVAISVNLSTGVATSATGSPTSIECKPVGNGWYRASFSYVPGSTASMGHTVRVSADGIWANRSYAGNGTGAIAAWGAQLNTGPLAPYVPTGALTASSTADVASITGAAFAGIWNQGAGTVYSDVMRLSAVPSGQFPRVWQAQGATTADRITFGYFVGGQLNVISASGVSQAEWYPAYFAENGVKAALAFTENSVAGASNGVLTGSDGSAIMPVVNQMFIGRDSTGSYLNGYIREMAILKSRRPNTNLQSMTQ
jgi:hypothetical protein